MKKLTVKQRSNHIKLLSEHLGVDVDKLEIQTPAYCGWDNAVFLGEIVYYIETTKSGIPGKRKNKSLTIMENT
jgi:hypothetical protein